LYSIPVERFFECVKMKSDVDGEKESESEDIVKVIEFPEKIEIKKERKKKFTENVIDRVELPIVSTQPEINYWKNTVLYYLSSHN